MTREEWAQHVGLSEYEPACADAQAPKTPNTAVPPREDPDTPPPTTAASTTTASPPTTGELATTASPSTDTSTPAGPSSTAAPAPTAATTTGAPSSESPPLDPAVSEWVGEGYLGPCDDLPVALYTSPCTYLLEESGERAILEVCFPYSECVKAALFEVEAGAWTITEEYTHSGELPPPPDYPAPPSWLTDARESAGN